MIFDNNKRLNMKDSHSSTNFCNMCGLVDSSVAMSNVDALACRCAFSSRHVWLFSVRKNKPWCSSFTLVLRGMSGLGW